MSVADGPDGGTYRTIVVVGGGCYGSYYVRQLGRARRAGRIAFERLLVVDRDPACRVAREIAAGQEWNGPDASIATEVDAGVELAVAEWAPFFASLLDAAAASPAPAADAIVPSPLMPHLMFDWLVGRAALHAPGRPVERRPLPTAPPTPWERAGGDGTHYVSFATWMCPINCIEPRRCPHTGGPRSWSMPDAAASYVAAERAKGVKLAGPAVLHCEHRAFGVGMFDVSAVVAADRMLAGVAAAGGGQLLVGTMSHCHGALGVLSIGG